MDAETEARVAALANEMQSLLEEYLLQDPSGTDAAMARVREIRTELLRMGFPSTYTCNFGLDSVQTPSVIVTIWIPKPDLSPEYQKIYDDWFARMNGITNP